MKLDDVLAAAGDHTLSTYDWGPGIVVLVNSSVPAECQIDLSLTGKEARTKLRSAPMSTLMAIMTRDIQLNGSSVVFAPTAIEHATGIPPTVPVTTARRMSPVAMVVMVFLALIGLAMTWSSIQVTQSTGQTQDHETLQVIIKTMTDLAREERQNTAPATP